MADQPFRDAEAWLAERGVRRDPLRVHPAPERGPDDAAQDGATHVPRTLPPPEGVWAGEEASAAPQAPVSAREAVRLASASSDEAVRAADERAADPVGRSAAPRLEDEVADAVAFVRRSTANAPQAEGRLAGKLRERGWSATVIEQALERCRSSGLVDDQAMAAALAEEGRRKGHAPTRLRADLQRRGLADDAIEHALAPILDEDPEAAAFDAARRKADTLTAVSAETAFRRIVAHLARRGHPEALARKVARAAVFDARDPERTSGH